MKNYHPTKRKIHYASWGKQFIWLGNESILPYCKFKWLNNFCIFDVNSVSENSSIGYILEVGLEYPDELHYLHNNYSLAPEKLAISYDMLSNYCKEFADRYGTKVGDVKKLVPNLGNKTNYVVHYKNCQLHLSIEMKLTKNHKILKLEQSDWLKKSSILIIKKEKMLPIVLKKTFLSWWLIVFMVK